MLTITVSKEKNMRETLNRMGILVLKLSFGRKKCHLKLRFMVPLTRRCKTMFPHSFFDLGVTIIYIFGKNDMEFNTEGQTLVRCTCTCTIQHEPLALLCRLNAIHITDDAILLYGLLRKFCNIHRHTVAVMVVIY